MRVSQFSNQVRSFQSLIATEPEIDFGPLAQHFKQVTWAVNLL